MTGFTDIIAQHVVPISPIPTGCVPGGTLLDVPRCILFDVYGTLLISASGDISMGNAGPENDPRISALFRRFRIHADPDVLMRRLTQAIKKAHEKQHRAGIDFPEVRIEDLWRQLIPGFNRREARRFAMHFEMIVNPVFPMPNAASMLQVCRSRGIPAGVVSNAQFFTPHVLAYFFGAPAAAGFQKQLLLYSFAMQCAKPSPRIFDAARRRLSAMGIQPRHALFVGNDMRNDVLPAHRAGFKTALFAGDKRSLRRRENDPDCRNTAPDLVLTDFNQLISMWQSAGPGRR